jgi:hypothetical protein
MLTDGMFAINANMVGTGKHQQQQLKAIAFNAVTASQDVRFVPIILHVHNATLDFTFQTQISVYPQFKSALQLQNTIERTCLWLNAHYVRMDTSLSKILAVHALQLVQTVWAVQNSEFVLNVKLEQSLLEMELDVWPLLLTAWQTQWTTFLILNQTGSAFDVRMEELGEMVSASFATQQFQTVTNVISMEPVDSAIRISGSQRIEGLACLTT